MKLAAFVVTILLSTAPMFAQGLIEYGGALGPGAGIAARPNNPASHIHLRPIVPADAQPARSATHGKQAQPAKSERVHSGGSATTRVVDVANERPSATQQAAASEKKDSNRGLAITIQR